MPTFLIMAHLRYWIDTTAAALEASGLASSLYRGADIQSPYNSRLLVQARFKTETDYCFDSQDAEADRLALIAEGFLILTETQVRDLAEMWFPVSLPVFLVQPANTSITEGDDAIFSVTVQNADLVRWQASDDAGMTWNDVVDGAEYSGSSTEALTVIMPAIAVSGLMFRVYAENNQGSVFSDSATLTVAPAAFDWSDWDGSNTTAIQTISGVPSGFSGDEVFVSELTENKFLVFFTRSASFWIGELSGTSFTISDTGLAAFSGQNASIVDIKKLRDGVVCIACTSANAGTYFLKPVLIVFHYNSGSPSFTVQDVSSMLTVSNPNNNITVHSEEDITYHSAQLSARSVAIKIVGTVVSQNGSPISWPSFIAYSGSFIFGSSGEIGVINSALSAGVVYWIFKNDGSTLSISARQQAATSQGVSSGNTGLLMIRPDRVVHEYLSSNDNRAYVVFCDIDTDTLVGSITSTSVLPNLPGSPDYNKNSVSMAVLNPDLDQCFIVGTVSSGDDLYPTVFDPSFSTFSTISRTAGFLNQTNSIALDGGGRVMVVSGRDEVTGESNYFFVNAP